MSQSAAPAPKRKLPVAKLAAGFVLLVIIAFLVWRGLNVRALMESFMAAIRARGPVAFFTAFAVLPALGFPVLAFGLTAGPAFGEQLGMGTVVGLMLVAITINFLLAYFLARRAFRPLLEKLMKRFGYAIPEVESGDATDLVLLLRLTPGIPFFVQNYLCGLAEVKFRKYVWLSCLIVWPMNAGTVYFAGYIAQGKAKLAIWAAMGIAAICVATHLARKHYTRKQKPAA